MTRPRLLAASVILLLTAPASLRLASLQTTRRMLGRAARTLHTHAQPAEAARAIEAVGRRLPWTPTCLHQALAGEALVNAAGYNCVLHIGARKHEGRHAFHAWLESSGVTILGASDSPHAALRAPPWIS